MTSNALKDEDKYGSGGYHINFLLRFSEFYWFVAYWTIETSGYEYEGPFFNEKKADEWAWKYISQDPKYYRAKVRKYKITEIR